jgi:anti-sigma factor RsiW
MQHLDEGTIHAWIDGELSPEQASELEAHVRDCSSCAAMVAEARGLVAASTRILTALDHVPGGVLPSVPDIAPAPVTRRRWYQRTDVRAAAALLFVAGASLVVARSRGTDLPGSRAMIVTADKAPASSSSSIAKETAGAEAAQGVQQGMADAANASPRATAPAVAERSTVLPGKASATIVSPEAAPELRFGAVGGARNQSPQPKVMADERASASAPRDESQLSKEEATKRRAADAVNIPPVTARSNAPATVAAPVEMRSRLDATRGSVEGRVTDKTTGQGVANAHVIVEGTTLSAATDKDGKFRIENVPQGARSLRVRRLGYAPGGVPLTVETGKVAAAQIGLAASTTALSEVVVTSIAGTAVPAMADVPLRIVRVDSTNSAKRTVYEISRGLEVTLTESPAQTAEERDNAANDLARQKAAAAQRSEAARETPQVLSGQATGAMAAPPAAPILPLNTISWTDRGKRYTLTGQLMVKDLEAIKARLMQPRR